MHSRRMCFIAVVTAAVLLASAFMPITAYAQDPLPPPPEAPEEQAPAPEPPPPDTPEEQAPAPEAPPLEQATSPDERPSQDAPVLEEIVPPTDEPEAAEQPTLAEVLELAPEGTEVAVLDSSGEPLALASNEAAQILTTGDPIWCPGASEPGAGCSTGYTSFSELLADLADDTEVGAGIIYVADDYLAPAADAGGIFFNWGDYSLTSLVIQGGWDFDTNTQGTTSTITVPMNILNWGAGTTSTQLTLNNLVFSGGASLNIFDTFPDATSANVTINNVSVTGAPTNGASIETTGNITVNNSEFKRNDEDGLDLEAGGNISINNVTARGNGGSGLDAWADGNLSVDGGAFSGNDYNGMQIGADGDVTLANFVAGNNYDFGVLGGAMGNLAVNGVTAHDNGFGGIVAGALGNSSLTDVTVTDNGYVGALVGAMGDASLSQVVARRNGILGAGAVALGDASLNDVIASYNGGVGAAALALGDASMTDVRANGNEYVGAAALAFGDTSMTGVIANENGLAGVVSVSLGGIPIIPMLFGSGGPLEGLDLGGLPYLGDALEEIDWYDATMNPATTTLTDVTANGNGFVGGVAASVGDVNVTGSTFNDNSLAGALAIAGGNVYVGNSVFNGNGMLGLGAGSLLDGNVTAYGITAEGNYGPGVVLGSGSLELTPYFPFISSLEPSLTAEVVLACSSVINNYGPGLLALTNTTSAGNDLTGNAGGPYQEVFGVVTESGSVDCAAVESMLSDYLAKQRAAKLETGGGCGDWSENEGEVTAVFHELCGHDAALQPPELPGELPSGGTQSALASVAGDLPQPDGYVILSFPVASGVDPASLTVMFWDGSQWTDVSGGALVDGKFEITVKEDGAYVLVQK